MRFNVGDIVRFTQSTDGWQRCLITEVTKENNGYYLTDLDSPQLLSGLLFDGQVELVEEPFDPTAEMFT